MSRNGEKKRLRTTLFCFVFVASLAFFVSMQAVSFVWLLSCLSSLCCTSLCAFLCTPCLFRVCSLSSISLARAHFCFPGSHRLRVPDSDRRRRATRELPPARFPQGNRPCSGVRRPPTRSRFRVVSGRVWLEILVEGRQVRVRERCDSRDATTYQFGGTRRR